MGRKPEAEISKCPVDKWIVCLRGSHHMQDKKE